MSHRIVNKFDKDQPQPGEDALNASLQLYKHVATVRDTKRVDIYLQIDATGTTVSPLRYFKGAGKTYSFNGVPFVPEDVPYYFAPLGTRRTIDIWEQINSLADLNLPKDKYMYQVNLAEAQIVQDPSNWVKQRNYSVESDSPFGENPQLVGTAYEPEYGFDPEPINGANQEISKIWFKQSTKKTQPEPLFVRLPQITSKPFNWTVVSNGQTNIDKSHQPEYVHDNAVFQRFVIEFGHLSFKGVQNDYQEFLDKIDGDDVCTKDFKPNTAPGWEPKVKNPISNYQDFTYLDYNWEWSNVTPQPGSGINNSQNEYVVPGGLGNANLKSKKDFDPQLPDEQILIANSPYKTNQQAKSILMRLSINIVHLF